MAKRRNPMSKKISLVIMGLILCSCAGRSVVPNVEEIKVSREAAGKNCSEIGKITGTTSSIKGTAEDALSDLKKEAANKGANYVMVKQYSDHQTSVTGIAYECK
jgi:uncharacterized protein YbjQ (UPF0145 family)